jgi:hypothetical protein
MNLSHSTWDVCGAYHEPLLNLSRSTWDSLCSPHRSTAWISQTSHPNCHAQSIHCPKRLRHLPLTGRYPIIFRPSTRNLEASPPRLSHSRDICQFRSYPPVVAFLLAYRQTALPRMPYVFRASEALIRRYVAVPELRVFKSFGTYHESFGTYHE